MTDAAPPQRARGPVRAPREGIWGVRAAGIAGLIFSILTVIALLLLRDAPPSSDPNILQWYEDESARITVATYIIPFAGIAFLWFLAAVRRRIGHAEDQFFSTVFLATGLLFTGMLFVSGAAATASALLAKGADQSTIEAVRVGRALAETVFYVFAIKMAAAFMLVTSTIARRTGVMPRVLVLAGIAGAIVMMVSVGTLEMVAVVFPLWTCAVSTLLLRLPRSAWDEA